MQVLDRLTEEQVATLRQGGPLRIAAPELGGDIVLILAAREEGTEKVLEEAARDAREKRGWTDAAGKSLESWAKDNSY